MSSIDLCVKSALTLGFDNWYSNRFLIFALDLILNVRINDDKNDFSFFPSEAKDLQ